ncbi:hypothetical protein MCOR27_008506 [Pyricularia oryzae]|uniref:Uncharacterized protein n=1 Tax=Pyricularia grisea TaxID=148305 RepID=A0ABQ8N726_PYRGI|nr:hypothetical protein MCOR01_008249 [Pyricularia oryzae]KAI6292317.1 hypothetical protein MCOR33_009942 [Pyricularia grisea]KAH9438849.1 hypothetical protein MCOR02_002447 [Pyricularia oryzae]KAI6259405.1 hypothetical protein MCOR19_004238 [Pyricularia oryzae]KAI6272124.1 hypothetical protein MCOR27_008506 [Pyricularia oryzae]
MVQVQVQIRSKSQKHVLNDAVCAKSKLMSLFLPVQGKCSARIPSPDKTIALYGSRTTECASMPSWFADRICIRTRIGRPRCSWTSVPYAKRQSKCGESAEKLALILGRLSMGRLNFHSVSVPQLLM